MANSVWVHAAGAEIVSAPGGLAVSREDTGLTLDGSGMSTGSPPVSVWGTGHVTLRFLIPLLLQGVPQHLKAVRLRFVSSALAGVSQVALHDGSDLRLGLFSIPPTFGDYSAVGGLAWDSEDRPACNSGLVLSVVVEMKRLIVSRPVQLTSAGRELIAKARDSLTEEENKRPCRGPGRGREGGRRRRPGRRAFGSTVVAGHCFSGGRHRFPLGGP